jgi:hypothetical protein
VAFSLLIEDVCDGIALSSFFPPPRFLKDNFVIGKVFGQRFPPQHRESFVVEFNYEQKQTRRSMIALRSTMMMVLVCRGVGGRGWGWGWQILPRITRCASDRLGVGMKE